MSAGVGDNDAKATMIVSLPHLGLDATVRMAVEVLERPGAVLLLPTETVYGLVGRADDAESIARIYELKGRDRSKPLGWFTGDWRKLEEFGVKLDGLPAKLAERYCPGSITIIAPRNDGSTIGFRVPDHPLLQEILQRVGVPLVQTSANRSGRPNALSVVEALAGLEGEIDLVVDAGSISADAMGSTVVDATGIEPRVLREGPIKL